MIQIRGDRIAVEPEPDAEGPHRDYMEAPVIPGMVVHVPKGGIETAVNVGDEPYYEIIVELKDYRGTDLARTRRRAVTHTAWRPLGSWSSRTGAVSGR